MNNKRADVDLIKTNAGKVVSYEFDSYLNGTKTLMDDIHALMELQRKFICRDFLVICATSAYTENFFQVLCHY